METLERFEKQRTIVLTTFKRDGTHVTTPVNIAIDPATTRGYVRTWKTSGKAKRIRNDHHVKVAPSTFRGRVTGPEVEATAHLVAGDDEARARSLLRRKYPIMHAVLVPLAHRLRRYETQHYEIRPGA